MDKNSEANQEKMHHIINLPKKKKKNKIHVLTQRLTKSHRAINVEVAAKLD